MSNMMLRQNFNPVHELMKDFFGQFPELNQFYQMRNGCSRLQVKVHDNAVCVKLPFPGCTPKDFEVEVVGDYLTVRAHRTQDGNEVKGKNYICRERSTESCQESVRLPVKVLGSETKAKYTDGILILNIPRDNEAAKKTVKTIQVD